MKRYYQALTYTLPFLSVLCLLLIISFTNPLSAGPGGILVVFLLMYVFWASVFFIILHVGIGLVGKFWTKRKNINMREWKIGVRRSYYIASTLAFAPVLLLAIQSVGQLQLRDIVLVVVLLVLVIFYLTKRS